MNQQEPTSEDPSVPSEPDPPVSAVSQPGPDDSRTALPPHWAFGYHEVYDEWPGVDELLRRIRRFAETDTPLASIELPPETSPGSDPTIDSIRDQLYRHGIRVSASLSTEDHRVTDEASTPNNLPSPRNEPGTPDASGRRLFFTEATGESIPRDAAVTVPVRFGSGPGLRELMAHCLDISSRGFPLCGPEFQNIESADPELAVRWIQVAALLPLLRVRISSLRPTRTSLWPFPQELTRTWRRYLGFRQKLFPYLYSTFDAYRRTGQPPIQAAEATRDSSTPTREDRLLSLGSALAIAPVDDGEAQQRSVRLPEGRWFHFWTNDPYRGGRSHAVPVSIHHIPVFARGGGVIPLYPFRRRLGETTPGTLVLRAYPHGSRTNAIYTDDGRTRAYEKGDYHRLLIDTKQNGDQFVLHFSEEGDREPPYDHLEWQVPIHLAASAAIEGHEPREYSVPEEFADANSGILRGHHFLRIRTPADVKMLEVKLQSEQSY